MIGNCAIKWDRVAVGIIIDIFIACNKFYCYSIFCVGGGNRYVDYKFLEKRVSLGRIGGEFSKF